MRAVLHFLSDSAVWGLAGPEEGLKKVSMINVREFIKS